MKHPRPSNTLLAGDVGGTKTTLALYDGDDVRRPRVARTHDSRTIETFGVVLNGFLAGEPLPAAATIAVAGPVVDDAAQITNLSWGLSKRDLAARLSTSRIELLNDVEALAGAVGVLQPEEIAPLQKGSADARGATAVLALGTGLGMAYITRAPHTLVPHVHPSEGGHADFAPASALQERLLASLWHEFGHVSVERVASGLGLPRIHRFLVAEERWPEDAATSAAIAAAADPTPVIVAAALSGRSAACREAVCLLCDVVAAEASDLALTFLATGGVFLGGGLAPRLLPFLRDVRFLAAFRAKGRFASLLERVPVSVILPSEAVLWGAALSAMRTSEVSGERG
jgi:glucokinase